MKALILLLVIGFSQVGFASAETDTGWKLIPKFMYMVNDSDTNGATNNQSRFLADGMFGYRLASPFFLGATYGYDNTYNNGGSSVTISGIGPTAGYMADNFYFLITYYVYDTEVDNNGGGATTTYSNGNGFQVDVSYLFDVGASWSLGPVLSYRSLHYSSVSPGGAVDYSHSTLLPYVGIVIGF